MLTVAMVWIAFFLHTSPSSMTSLLWWGFLWIILKITSKPFKLQWIVLHWILLFPLVLSSLPILYTILQNNNHQWYWFAPSNPYIVKYEGSIIVAEATNLVRTHLSTTLFLVPIFFIIYHTIKKKLFLLYVFFWRVNLLIVITLFGCFSCVCRLHMWGSSSLTLYIVHSFGIYTYFKKTFLMAKMIYWYTNVKCNKNVQISSSSKAIPETREVKPTKYRRG